MKSGNLEKEHLVMKLSALKKYEKNVKNHTKENLKAIIASIKEDWYIAPIVVDENNVILAWHGRRLALLEIGKDEVDVIRITGLTDEQKKRYRVKDNKLSELSLWNIDNLESELQDLFDEWDEETFKFFDIKFDFWEDLGGIETRKIDETDQTLTQEYSFDHSYIKSFVLHYSDEEYIKLIERLDKLAEKWYWNDFSSIIYKLVDENTSSE